MQQVKAKKHLGQHFLKDPEIARSIADSLAIHTGYKKVLEIGPGMGILTRFLLANNRYETWVSEIDPESIQFIRRNIPELDGRILEGDFLQLNLPEIMKEPFAIIGNFPYNISSQILFRVLDNRELVPEVTGMFQKEVAERIASGPGNKEYGILSVFLQAYYQVELLFYLDESAFEPAPKVKSAVLHFTRKENFKLGCNEKKFRAVVKAGFNQRRKTLSNALASLAGKERSRTLPYASLRAEALTWEQFVELTNLLETDTKPIEQ